MESAKPKLLVTGITGYVGAWVTLKVLETDQYSVRGTVRDKSNEAKMQALKEAFGDHFDKIELFNADLTDKESLRIAAEGCDYVIHVASPFPLEDPKNEDEVIKPAVEGTTGILEAVKGTQIKRVVITSSIVAIVDYTMGNIEVDETSWPSNLDALTPYYKSKTLAERAAWDFIENLEEDEKFELVTINPGLVIGPLLTKGTGTSQKLFTDFMRGKFPSAPQIYTSVVDVRDVADAHVKALTCEPYKRYAVVDDTYLLPDLCKMLRKEFRQYGYKVTYRKTWKSTAYLASVFIKSIRQTLKSWKIRCHVKNDNAKKDLGIDFIKAEKSMVDMGYSLIKHGFVPDKISKIKT